ncbi:MAG TPA: hypothetical protein VEL76_31440 [Gemmataceae bacterium]|nr:hypothetical protein [Gemmataceae bacterium]
MTPFQPIQDHLSRRAMLKGIVGTATGAAVADWGLRPKLIRHG